MLRFIVNVFITVRGDGLLKIAARFGQVNPRDLITDAITFEGVPSMYFCTDVVRFAGDALNGC